MKNLKKFEEFSEEEMNENWRQWKFKLGIPLYIMNGLFAKLLNLEANINLRYKQLSAKVDLGQSIEVANEIKEEPIKITLDKFKGTKLYPQLLSSGFLKEWNVYHIGNIGVRKFNINDNNKDKIYITKDEFKKGDKIFGRRINDRHISSEKLDFMVIIGAKKTDDHDDMRREREIRRNKGLDKQITKLYKKAIKEKDYDVSGEVDRNKKMKLIYALVKYDRPKLLDKIIDMIPEEKRKEELGEQKYQDGIWYKGEKVGKYSDSGTTTTLFQIAKSGKVKALLIPYQSQSLLNSLFGNEETDDFFMDLNESKD